MTIEAASWRVGWILSNIDAKFQTHWSNDVGRKIKEFPNSRRLTAKPKTNQRSKEGQPIIGCPSILLFN
jgi:hypothetical protein